MANTTADNKRQTFRQNVEMPVEMRVTGMPVTVHGTVMDISVEGCRIRSLIALDKGAPVRFDIKSGGKTVELRGRIAARKKVVGHAFYEYGISFDKISTAENDALVAAIMEFQRRAAAERTESKDVATESGKGGQKRGAYRALVAFPIRFRRDGQPGATVAEANDLSATGLRLITDKPMPKDAVLTLEFTLPNEILAVYSGSAPEQDPSPFGARGEQRPKPKDPRRPFETMTLKGRVLARLKDSAGRVVLGIQFVDADAFKREEIQRYIHAVQLYKIRTSVNNL